jgi:hypothetical protein
MRHHALADASIDALAWHLHGIVKFSNKCHAVIHAFHLFFLLVVRAGGINTIRSSC